MLYFKPLEYHLNHVYILIFPDYTVIYVGARSKIDIVSQFNEDLENMRSSVQLN